LRRIESHLNHRYVLGKLPLVLVLVFFILMAFMARLTATFHKSYEKRPVLTMMVTNAVLAGIADCVAQGVTIVRERSMREGRTTPLSIELHDLEKRLPTPEGRSDIIPPRDDLPPPFDGERLFRFVLYGFGVGAVQFKWYQILDKAIPVIKGSLIPPLKRVAMDQLGFAPVSLGVFYGYMSLMEGKNLRETKYKIQQLYWPTLKANWILWPAVQALNFSIVPLKFQVPLVSSVNIAWTCYLSTMNSAAPAKPVQLN